MFFLIILIIIFAIIAIALSSNNSNNTPQESSAVFDEALVLTEIFVKFAKAKFDYGTFSASSDGHYYAHMDGFMEYNLTDQGLKYGFGFTVSEIQFIRSHRIGTSDSELLSISLRLPPSRNTFHEVHKIIENNRQYFSSFQSENNRINIKVNAPY